MAAIAADVCHRCRRRLPVAVRRMHRRQAGGRGGPPLPDGEALYTGELRRMPWCRGRCGDGRRSRVTAVFAAPRPIPSSSGSCCAGFPAPACRRAPSAKRRPRRSCGFCAPRRTGPRPRRGTLRMARRSSSARASARRCHRVDGVGARTGPDLSDVGRLRHSTDIERSILEPDFYDQSQQPVRPPRHARWRDRNGPAAEPRHVYSAGSRCEGTAAVVAESQSARVHVSRQIADAGLQRQVEQQRS